MTDSTAWRATILRATFAALTDCDDHTRDNAYMEAFWLSKMSSVPMAYRAEAAFSCARVLYAQEKYEDALMFARRAYHFDPSSPVAPLARDMAIRIIETVNPAHL
jgi:hypothetical protein